MPRKVFHGADYDEDYYDDYDYGDYDEDEYYNSKEGGGYDHGLDDNAVKSSQQEKTVSNPGIWRCSICTYDNDESSLSCDICGAVCDAKSSVNLAKVDEAKASTSSSSSIIEEKGVLKFPANNSTPGNITRETADMSQGLSRNKSLTVGGQPIISSKTKELSATPQVLSTDLDNLKLDTSVTNSKKDKPLSQYKPEKWMLSDQEQGALNQLNLAIVGHVDSGKSTLSGRLLHLLGRISKKDMHKYEKEAKQMGKGSFAYAWAMDESVEERERGVTMTVAVAYFDSKKYRVVLLDSPGHKDFVPNMISGATQADAAVLVVDSSKGSFEAGMDGYGIGQTKEHAQLIRSFGVEQIIVAVNKMDVVDFSKERFDFIKLQLGSFLKSCGFKESSVTWIPLSVMGNQNLVTRPDDDRLTSWYQGICLLEAIDSLEPPLRDFSKPLRLPICDVTKSHSLGHLAACGKLETGAIRNGSKVLVMPSGDVATVRSIERDSSSCSIARAGDNVAVSLAGIEWGHVMPGGVLCHPDFPVTLATTLELKILVLDITTPILIGTQVEFHIHHAKEAARVVKIVSLLDPKTGKVSKSLPRALKAKQSAIIEVTLDERVCVEEFSKCRALGRAFLRSSGNTIAVGVVTRVLEQRQHA
ncbi:HBS1-like protein [Iris pallida]|uniref:HBS1-like protein n=1 Tax=Iris pallida TaxID=29817 RepID=A0AAX6FEP5_IRIPA|nr:HBS1-like protein [Iris pallida]